ncbi:MAG TPA: ABC transporter permease subunit [Acidimicrobiia bacterium]|nr:ABC transporter permease subunit [Acidimicrobiia bacterium]
MLRSVFTKDLWDRRRSAIWWIVGVALLNVWIASVYPVIRDSDAMKDFINEFPPEMLALFGIDPDTFLTGAGFLQSELFSVIIPIIVITFGVLAGTAATAREEKDGTMDVLLSVPITRPSIVLQKAASMTLISAAIMAATALALMGMNVAVDLSLSITNLVAVCVGAWLLGLLFGSVAMAIGAVTGSPGATSGAAVSLAILSWFVTAFASLYSWLELPAKLSPFSWYLDGNPLLNGFSSGHLWLLAGALAGIAGATVLFTRRNIGVERVVLPKNPLRQRRGKVITPRTPWLLGSVFGKALWDRRRSVWVWAVGLSSLSLLTFAAWPALAKDSEALMELLEAFPKEVLAMMGLTDASAIATPEGFVSTRTYGAVGPVVIIVFAISAMSSLVAKEEASGVLDLVMSASQRRRALLREKALAVFTLVGIIAVFLFVVALVGNAVWDLGISFTGIFAANVGLALFGLCFWGIAVALWSLLPNSSAAVGVTAAFAIVAFFLNGLGVIVDSLAPARWISPFYWYLGDTVPLAKGITWGYVALGIVALAGTAIAIARFEHRDLAV